MCASTYNNTDGQNFEIVRFLHTKESKVLASFYFQLTFICSYLLLI